MQRQTGINPCRSKMKQLGQESVGVARKDGIRGQDHERKKAFQQESRPHLDWQSAVVSGGEPVQDKKMKNG